MGPAVRLVRGEHYCQVHHWRKEEEQEGWRVVDILIYQHDNLKMYSPSAVLHSRGFVLV